MLRQGTLSCSVDSNEDNVLDGDMNNGWVNECVVNCDFGNDDIVGNFDPGNDDVVGYVAPGDGDLAGVYYLVNTDQPFPDVCNL